MLVALRADLLWRRPCDSEWHGISWFGEHTILQAVCENRSFRASDSAGCQGQTARLIFAHLVASDRFSCAPGSTNYALSCFLLGLGH